MRDRERARWKEGATFMGNALHDLIPDIAKILSSECRPHLRYPKIAATPPSLELERNTCNFARLRSHLRIRQLATRWGGSVGKVRLVDTGNDSCQIDRLEMTRSGDVNGCASFCVLVWRISC